MDKTPPFPVPSILASILAADFGHLQDVLRRIEAGGADGVHVDVMDGHFVPNISMGPVVLEALRRGTDLPLDVHLMIERPERYIDAFVGGGADHLTVHLEALGDGRIDAIPEGIDATIERIHRQGASAGLAISPDTPWEAVLPHAGKVELVLIMTVHPGFSGQEFIGSTLAKVARAAAWRAEVGAGFRLQVDGGIHPGTIQQARRAGADSFVAASAIFGRPAIEEAIRELRDLVDGVSSGASIGK